jgi:zinc transport system ATP-binding protein
LSIKFADALINVKKLSYKNILQNINFCIKRGDYVAIIGPNGGGKSTLVRLLLGLLKSTDGVVELFGKEQGDFREYHKIGYVPQRAEGIDVSFPISVEEVIGLGLAYKSSLFKRGSADEATQIQSVMEKMDILELKDRRISDLSGGQRQRVMIARALVSRPQILILDEPNAGVDTHSQRKFYDLLKELNEKEKITILFVTHDLGVIADDVKSVLCINQTLFVHDDAHEILNCSEMSKLYGMDTHLVCHHH